MGEVIKYLSEKASTPCVLGVNGGVLAVSMSEVEAALKILLLIASLALTGLTLYAKLRRRR